MSAQTKCRAMNPSTCRVHGTGTLNFSDFIVEQEASKLTNPAVTQERFELMKSLDIFKETIAEEFEEGFEDTSLKFQLAQKGCLPLGFLWLENFLNK
jgi:hypothetical protein